MAKRTSIAKQLGLSNDPVQPKEFSREAFRLTPSPARGGGWTPAVAETPTAGNTTIGRLAGALSSVSGLLAQAKAFEDKKLEMEQQGLQIDHQTALVQLQGQGADARSASLAAQMDIAQQQTAEAFELDRLQQINPEDRKFAASHASEYVEEADQQRKDAQVEMVRADALVPVAQKHPVVKNEIREIFRGNEAAATYFDDLADDLEEWKKGPEGGDGVFTPSEDEFNQYVAQWTQDYKDKLQITANSAAEGAFNTSIAVGYNKTLPRYKREVFDYVERASLNDFQQQANLNLDAAYNSTLGGLEGETGEVNYDTLLSAPWWNTIRQKNPDEVDAFINRSVLGSVERALNFGQGSKPLLALKELEKAKIMLGLPDSDKGYKYRGKISFGESTLGQKLLSDIYATEANIEEKALLNTGKKGAAYAEKIKASLLSRAYDQSFEENLNFSSLLSNPNTNNIEVIKGMFSAEEADSAHAQALFKEYEEMSVEERIIANESLYRIAETTRVSQLERASIMQRYVASNMEDYGNSQVYDNRRDDKALIKQMVETLVNEDGQTIVSNDVRAALGDPMFTEGPEGQPRLSIGVVNQLTSREIRAMLADVKGETLIEPDQATHDFFKEFKETNGVRPNANAIREQLAPILRDIAERGFLQKMHDRVLRKTAERDLRLQEMGEPVRDQVSSERDPDGRTTETRTPLPNTFTDFYSNLGDLYKTQESIKADATKIAGKPKKLTKQDRESSQRFLDVVAEQKAQAEVAYTAREKALTNSIYDHMTRGFLYFKTGRDLGDVQKGVKDKGLFKRDRGFTQERYNAAQRTVLDSFENKVGYGISADEAMA